LLLGRTRAAQRLREGGNKMDFYLPICQIIATFVSHKTLSIMTLYPKLIRDILATVIYPGTKKNLIESDMVADNIRINGNKVSFSLIFPRDTDPFMKSTVKAAEATLKYKLGDDVEVTIHTEFRSAPRPEVDKLLPNVKNIIAVSSGKGGVGKSTVAVNLAIALAKLGYKVGLLDTDIFGPSIPKMFGVENARLTAVERDGRQLIEPIVRYGVKILSIGFVVDPDRATLWRGGMATGGTQATHRRRRLGRSRLLCARHASRHIRHPSHAAPDAGHHGSRHRLDAAACGAGRCT
jgi:ATP-binding protein involved in chromosome partitioning